VKIIEIYRDATSGRLAYRVREEGKTIQEEQSSHTDIRKLRRHLRGTFGRSVKLFGLGI
jgi:hypothetical protein